MRHPLLPLALAASLLSCGRQDRSVRIGCVGTLAGQDSAIGQSCRSGYQLAADEWNARGGVLERPVRLIHEDDKGDPGQGAALFMKLIEGDRVAGILGPALTKVAMAAAPLAQRSRVPMVAPAATTPRATAAGDYVFRACFTDTLQGAVGARFAFHHLGARRAACLYDLENDYPLELAGSFRTTFTALGGRMVGTEGHPSGAVDFKAQLAKLLYAKPDLLYLPDYSNDAALIARQARELGYQGPLLGGDGWDTPDLVRLGGSALEKGFFTSHCAQDDPDPRVRTFVGAYRAALGREPDAFAILGYDAAHILLDAIRRAGTTDGPAVREALECTDLAIVSGRIRFDEHHDPIKPVTILEVKEGRRVFRAKVGS